MKRYCDYMDSVELSQEARARLMGLTVPQKTARTWKKYAAMAAALVVVAGAGAWALGGADWFRGESGGRGTAEAIRENFAPDIALVEPSDVEANGMRTIGGYEVPGEGGGPETPVSYYVLPYIEYGMPSGVVADYSLCPPDGGTREATRQDVLALLGADEQDLAVHLNWEDYELTGGMVGFETDGSVWMMELCGTSADGYFTLSVSPNRLPPICVVLEGVKRTVTEVWGVEITGEKNVGAYGDTERGIFLDVTRQVEFIANGVGCRFRAYGTEDDAVEEFTSRFVRWAVLEGLDLSAISPEGVEFPAYDTGFNVDEPNWEDLEKQFDPAYGVGEENGDGVLSTEPFDPAAPDTNPDTTP